jgi:MFS family permease
VSDQGSARVTSQAASSPDPSAPGPSPWDVFRHPAYTVILIATIASGVGSAMFDMASSWLMTSLNSNPLMVSAVQVATMGPMFLLTIPAGALADIADPRRLLILAQYGLVAVGVAFASVVSLHLATPLGLLTTTFLLGALGRSRRQRGRSLR